MHVIKKNYKKFKKKKLQTRQQRRMIDRKKLWDTNRMHCNWF